MYFQLTCILWFLVLRLTLHTGEYGLRSLGLGWSLLFQDGYSLLKWLNSNQEYTNYEAKSRPSITQHSFGCQIMFVLPRSWQKDLRQASSVALLLAPWQMTSSFRTACTVPPNGSDLFINQPRLRHTDMGRRWGSLSLRMRIMLERDRERRHVHTRCTPT